MDNYMDLEEVRSYAYAAADNAAEAANWADVVAWEAIAEASHAPAAVRRCYGAAARTAQYAAHVAHYHARQARDAAKVADLAAAESAARRAERYSYVADSAAARAGAVFWME